MRVHRAGERPLTRADGVETRHSFSFGAHYDPGNVGVGLLVAHNDERLAPGRGYAEHPHRDLEIVTVVLSGALRHTSEHGTVVLGPGEVQRLSAGSGVVHSEVSDGPPTRFLQTWVRPAQPGGASSYARAEAVTGTGLMPLAGRGAPLDLAAPATLLRGSGAAELPDAPWTHLFVVSGHLRVEAGDGECDLGAEDAVRLHGGGRVTGEGDYLVWSG